MGDLGSFAIDGVIVPATPTPTPSLAGHVAIVTGANHGIGAAIAVALAASGCGVLISYLRVEVEGGGEPEEYGRARASAADDVLAAIEPLPGRAFAIEADLTDADTVPTLFDEAETSLGPVDIVVNNASGWMADTFTPTTTDQIGRVLGQVAASSIDRNFGVDARAGALMIAELAARHARRGATWGRIVGLTSGGPGGFPEEASYGAAKAALEHYTMTAATELAPFGITANIIHPPVTDTGWITDEVRTFVDHSPGLGGVAQPTDVAEVVAWLCSDSARLVTGNVIRMR